LPGSRRSRDQRTAERTASNRPSPQ
jgi:hypothetical protein